MPPSGCSRRVRRGGIWRLGAAWILLCSGALLPAQEGASGDGWEEVEDWEQDSGGLEVGDQPSAAPSWRRYLTGSLGVLGAAGEDTDRHSAALSLRYDYSSKKVSTVWEVTAASQSVSLDQTLRTELRDADDPLQDRTSYKEERTIKVEESFVEIQDGYFSYELLPSLVASLGRSRVTWGQFDSISPVNLMLPLQFQSRSLELSKRNFRRPQDHVSLHWFPHERWEFQLYYFPTTRLDKLLLEILENEAATEEERLYEYNNTTGEVDEADVGMRSVADLEDHDQQAFRALFYPDWGIIGFTWYEGREHLFYEEQRFVESVVDANDGIVAYNVRRQIDLLPAKGWGLEIAVPVGNWTWKAELYYADSFADIHGRSRTITSRTADSDKRYYDLVLTENKGRLFVPIDRYLIGLGADADLGRWKLNLALMVLTQEESTKVGEELVELEDRVSFLNEDDDDLVFPAINITRDVGSGRAHIGSALGFFGSFAGLLFYYHNDVSDSFNWQIGLEVLRQGSDELISEANEGVDAEDDLYELEGDLSGGAHLSFFYSF